MIFARKIYKIPEFYMIFARKMPKFYIIIARKIFFPNFRGDVPPPAPSSPTPLLSKYIQLYGVKEIDAVKVRVTDELSHDEQTSLSTYDTIFTHIVSRRPSAPTAIAAGLASDEVSLKPNTHRRRRRDSTAELSRVGVAPCVLDSQLVCDDYRRIDLVEKLKMLS